MWVASTDLPQSAGHPFYARLNRVLDEAGFDAFVEAQCAKFYADGVGRPSLAPGRYFRLLLLGYIERLDSERAIAWRAGRVQPLVSRDTATELLRVLTYPKFGLTAEERQDLLDDYLPCCETVAVPEPPPAVPQCRDPFDRPFLDLALAARADGTLASQ